MFGEGEDGDTVLVEAQARGSFLLFPGEDHSEHLHGLPHVLQFPPAEANHGELELVLHVVVHLFRDTDASGGRERLYP